MLSVDYVQTNKNKTDKYKEALIYSSCLRRLASKALKTLDPGMRRDDDEGINQRSPNNRI